VLGGRAAARSVEGSFVLSRAEVVPRHVVFHVRSGLETLLLEELQQREPEWRPHVLGHGRVGAWTTGDLLRLQRPRLALFFGFPMPEVPSATDECDAVAQSLTGRASRELLSTRFAGALRYRLEWHGRGHQRAASLRVAELVRRRWPELVNDTQNAPWEARIVTSRAGVHVEWVPRGLEDPRFAYRRASVPAASHPTIAAALARLGGVQEHDVVWDPFVGSGTELAERALLGPYRQLLGTDRDPKALTAAEANLRDVTRCSLILADALEHTPHLRPTLVLTNPPLGRRCPTDVERLTRRVLERCAGLLGSDGRLAWITPSAALRPEGFRTERRFEIDLGGFQGEMQLLRPR